MKRANDVHQEINLSTNEENDYLKKELKVVQFLNTKKKMLQESVFKENTKKLQRIKEEYDKKIQEVHQDTLLKIKQIDEDIEDEKNRDLMNIMLNIKKENLLIEKEEKDKNY